MVSSHLLQLFLFLYLSLLSSIFTFQIRALSFHNAIIEIIFVQFIPAASKTNKHVHCFRDNERSYFPQVYHVAVGAQPLKYNGRFISHAHENLTLIIGVMCH